MLRIFHYISHNAHIGLANRLVSKGQSLEEAKQLARQIISFPQKCLRNDLLSARHAAYSGQSLEDRLRQELEGGKEVVKGESLEGAQRFAGGEGRGGKFNFSVENL